MNRLIMGITLAGALASTEAVAQSAQRGHEAAMQWCGSCHIVSGQVRANDMVPSFDTIANQPNYTDDRLRGIISNPHPPMPPLQITRSDIESFVLYFRTLRR
jgi:mono/diheme cytochrome c family protein